MPLNHTHFDDARDLILTLETTKDTKKDNFFHNANSMLRMVLLRIPIDNSVKHIEDRSWADQVIKRGYFVAYLPEAKVYHYHGLHQHGRNASLEQKVCVSDEGIRG